MLGALGFVVVVFVLVAAAIFGVLLGFGPKGWGKESSLVTCFDLWSLDCFSFFFCCLVFILFLEFLMLASSIGDAAAQSL